MNTPPPPALPAWRRDDPEPSRLRLLSAGEEQPEFRLLPRADVPTPVRSTRWRDRWAGSGRRWFGRWPFLGSAVFHVVLLAVVVVVLAVPAPPDKVGVNVEAVLTPDICELPEPELLDTPDDPVPDVVELPPVPVVPDEAPLEQETLEPLEEDVVYEREPDLPIELATARVRPKREPVVRPVPPPPVYVPRPRRVPVVKQPLPVARERLRPTYAPRHYPEQARQFGLQGRTKVAVTIDANGSVIDARVVASSGYDVLDSAALSSARMWRFTPPGTTRRAILPFLFDLNRG
jgi:protein TonB